MNKNLHSKSGTSISVRNLPRAHDNLLKGSIMVYSMDCKGNFTGQPHDLNGKIYGFSGWDFPNKTNPSMYPLVNPLFRLGHFPVRKLWMFTRGHPISQPVATEIPLLLLLRPIHCTFWSRASSMRYSSPGSDKVHYDSWCFFWSSCVGSIRFSSIRDSVHHIYIHTYYIYMLYVYIYVICIYTYICILIY